MSSALDNPNYNYAVNYIASGTGLSQKVVAAWVRAENGFGINNPLGVNSGAYYNNLTTALQDTVNLINTSPNYAGIRASVGQDPNTQAQAIVNSPWVSGTNSNAYVKEFNEWGFHVSPAATGGDVAGSSGSSTGTATGTETSFQAPTSFMAVISDILQLFSIQVNVINVMVFFIGLFMILIGLWKLLSSDQQDGIKQLAKAVTLMATGPTEVEALPQTVGGMARVSRSNRAPTGATAGGGRTAGGGTAGGGGGTTGGDGGTVPVTAAIFGTPTPAYSSETPRNESNEEPKPKTSTEPSSTSRRGRTMRSRIREALSRAEDTTDLDKLIP